MHPTLPGGHVQRVIVARAGDQEVALLHVRVPGQTFYVVVAGGVGIGVVDAAGRARLREAAQGPPAPSQARWRARLEGARVVAVGLREVAFAREGAVWVARAEAASLALVGYDADSDDAARSGAIKRVGAEPLEALQARGAALIGALGEAGADSRSEALRRALAKASSRVARRVDAVRGDLARAESADDLARRAQLFVAEASRVPRGASQLVAVDWTTGEAREVTMKLDPARGAQEQIDALFRRARRLKEGARIARSRLADAESILAALADVARALESDAPDLAALETRARAAAPRDFRLGTSAAAATPRPRADQTPRPPFRVFLGASGRRILVGRGAEKNDALTFHVARPHDLWLHAKDRAGAHVVVTLDKGASCPADLLVEAAHLAAHFSDARDEHVVDIQYTPRRYLRKPRGSAPGFVVVDREKVMALRRQDEILRLLLEREVNT
jgi:hypothetical protein